jgi:hypothetical protein
MIALAVTVWALAWVAAVFFHRKAWGNAVRAKPSLKEQVLWAGLLMPLSAGREDFTDRGWTYWKLALSCYFGGFAVAVLLIMGS